MTDGNQKKAARSKKRKETIKMRAAGVWDVFSDAIENFSANGDGNQAAAIALYSILSAIPLFILTMLAAGSFLNAMPRIETDILEAIQSFHPYFSGKILDQLGQIDNKGNILGWIGVLGLVWLSTAIFNAIESALNIIFRSHRTRNYISSKLMAFSMIPAAWIIGGLSVFLSYAAALLAKTPLVLPGGIQISLTLPMQISLRYVIPYVLMTILVALVYRLIPASRIRFSVALIGSAIFTLLLEIAKQFFTWYVANYTRYNVIFGSLEAVVILVVWVFYVALIFLFCAEMISSYERRDVLLLEQALTQSDRSNRKLDERLFAKFGRTYVRDSIIFQENDVGHEMFYILSGRVGLEYVDYSVKKKLAEMGPGQHFGEMAALINIRRSTTARALEDCRLAVIDNETFRNLVRESRDVALYMLREFALRLKNTNATLSSFTHLRIRLLILLQFINNPKNSMDEHISALSQALDKPPEDIRTLVEELRNQNILIVHDGHFTALDGDKIWTLVNSGNVQEYHLEEGGRQRTILSKVSHRNPAPPRSGIFSKIFKIFRKRP